MIANAQEIFGCQDVASAQEYACAEVGFSRRHCTSKKIRAADSLEGNRDAGMRVRNQQGYLRISRLVRLLRAPSYRAGVSFPFCGYKLVKAISVNYQTGMLYERIQRDYEL
jgi:hypothetical protein